MYWELLLSLNIMNMSIYNYRRVHSCTVLVVVAIVINVFNFDFVSYDGGVRIYWTFIYLSEIILTHNLHLDQLLASLSF